MNYCEDCKLLDLCGLEGSCDDALTFCAHKSEFISRGVIEDIKKEIEEKARPFEIGGRENGKSIRYGMYLALEIIDKHLGKESK